MSRINLFLFFYCMATVALAQENQDSLLQHKTVQEAALKAAQAELKAAQAEVRELQSAIAAITEQLTPYPRWKKGLRSNIGLNFSNYQNWLPKDHPSTSAINIGLATTAFANANYKNAFWRNSANLTLGWLKFDNKDNPDDNNAFQVAADAFNISSLYGRNLARKLAVSALGEYRTSILDGKLNNPGYLDLGVGATWTPLTDLVVVAHPLNYNFVFAEDGVNFNSSLGAKIVADYTRQLGNIGWKSNLSAFISYENRELSNWTWVNGFSTAVKGVGIGLDVGLRNNKQEALSAERSDNPLQTYWILGLSYAISR